MSKMVVFIHGAWLTPACWEPWRLRYEGRGFTCLAPAWPFTDRPLAALRQAPRPELRRLSIRPIVDHYDSIVRRLPEPPILIGHSFGGLFVQQLLDRGLGAAGVAIDPVSPRGVLPRPTALRAALPALKTFNGWNRTLTMTFARFARDVAHTLPADEARAAYDRLIVPAPGRLLFQAALHIGTRVNAGNARRAPLLLIAGEADRTIEASMVRAAYRRHRRSSAITAFRAFAGRSHLLIAEPGWEEIADAALDWAAGVTSLVRGAHAV
jgi:pimeloyl-ACP methyl ester carboxylesterase